MSPITLHDDEGMEMERRPSMLTFLRGLMRVVMWAAACMLIVAASIDGIFNDRYAQAGFEVALVAVFLLFEILDAVKR